MAQRKSGPMAKDELLTKERELLTGVSAWYKNTNWGFYTKIVWYSYVSIKPLFHGDHCLEMGPADGEMTRFIKDDFKKLTVVDASEQYVEAAKKISKNIDGHTALFEEFEPTEKYDTIVMSHVLEHVQDPVLVLQRARTWLKPGGRIIAVVPNADSLHRRLGVKLGMLEQETQLNDQDIEIGHRRVYTREALDRDIRSAELQSITKGGIFMKLLSNNQMLTFDDPKLIDAMFELGKDFPQYCSEIYAVCVPTK
ncbi:MAG TPA: class I SAM-dependent methyltransferase [Patescibacteria group bacterium]|nr:class I SAM-dependent methyltransferase [Patescibacteria group bacterium]